MRASPWPAPGLALGEHYRDICADTDACGACSLWPRSGESEAVWHARIGALLRRLEMTARPSRRTP